MEQYDRVAQLNSQQLTQQYSSSFGMATASFPRATRPHIYNVYGLVRVADEIVDSYHGPQAGELLDKLEADTYLAIKLGYSPNPIVHAFQMTARQFGITKKLIAPFFASMRVDLQPPATFTNKAYRDYIYGSAEVVGLMCLRVFCLGDDTTYKQLEPGARALGSAFQKVNFLRDLAADHDDLGRCYFPSQTYDTFDDHAKQAVIADIQADFAAAAPAVNQLPDGVRQPVTTAMLCYQAVLRKLAKTPVSQLKRQRLRISDAHKLWYLVTALGGRRAKA